MGPEASKVDFREVVREIDAHKYNVALSRGARNQLYEVVGRVRTRIGRNEQAFPIVTRVKLIEQKVSQSLISDSLQLTFSDEELLRGVLRDETRSSEEHFAFKALEIQLSQGMSRAVEAQRVTPQNLPKISHDKKASFLSRIKQVLTASVPW